MTDEQRWELVRWLDAVKRELSAIDSPTGWSKQDEKIYQALRRLVEAVGKWSYRARCLRLGFYEHLPLKDLFGFLKEIKKFDPSREDE